MSWPHSAKGLAETGYVEGQNVTIEYRWAEGQYDRLPALAADLVRRQVAVIVATGGNAAALAAKAATSTIPIVFSSRRRPGQDRPRRQPQPAGRQRHRRKHIWPASWSPSDSDCCMSWCRRRIDRRPGQPEQSTPPSTSCETCRRRRALLGLQIAVVQASTDREIETAFEPALLQHASARSSVAADPFFNTRREQLVALAARHAVPAMYQFREYRRAGGLMSYGIEHRGCVSPGRRLCRSNSQGRQAGRPAGHAADQVRAGHQPQDRQGARPHGPDKLLALADEVIE